MTSIPGNSTSSPEPSFGVMNFAASIFPGGLSRRDLTVIDHAREEKPSQRQWEISAGTAPDCAIERRPDY
jgi:hypothetical protein